MLSTALGNRWWFGWTAGEEGGETLLHTYIGYYLLQDWDLCNNSKITSLLVLTRN